MDAKSCANVVYIFDENYAALGGTSITSLFENNRDLDEITVYILSEGFNKENTEKFARLAESHKRKIIIMNLSDKIEEFKSMRLAAYKGSYIAYMKIFFPDYLPDEVESCIYIDADTIVLGSIRPILKSVPLIGMGKHTAISDAGRFASYEAPFNSITMCFNVKRWRDEKWSDKIISHIRQSKDIYLYADEGLLNTVCKDKIVSLPLEFGFDAIFCAIPKEDFLAVAKRMSYTREEIADAYDAPVIIHGGPLCGEKPWQQGTIHPQKIYFDTWMERSLWKDYVKPPIKTNLLYSFEKWIYLHLSKRSFYRVWLVAQEYYVFTEYLRVKKRYKS